MILVLGSLTITIPLSAKNLLLSPNVLCFALHVCKDCGCLQQPAGSIHSGTFDMMTIPLELWSCCYPL